MLSVWLRTCRPHRSAQKREEPKQISFLKQLWLKPNGRAAEVKRKCWKMSKCVKRWQSEGVRLQKTACALKEPRELQLQRMWLSCKYCQYKGQSPSLQPSVARERGQDEKETDKARNRGNGRENERGCVGFVLLRWKSSGTHITQSFTTICSHTCLIAHTWHTRTHVLFKSYFSKPMGTLSCCPH